MGREPSVPEDFLTGVHVLVVDDNADARELFKTILEYAGALVSVAPSAAHALAMCEHVLPNVLVTDIAMPDRDGFWLLAELRARQAAHHRPIPVVAVTGQGDTDPARYGTAGFADVLRKPVDPWALCRALERHAHRG